MDEIKYDSLDDIPHIGKVRKSKLEEIGIKDAKDFFDFDFHRIAEVIGYTPAYKARRSFENFKIEYKGMEKIEEGLERPVNVGGEKIEPWVSIDQLQLNNFKLEHSTLWSFEERGNWATHDPSFRGNWSPKVARNLILRYSDKEDTVLDPMVGGGTTLLECLLTGRNGIGVDINKEACKITNNRINLPRKYLDQLPPSNQEVYVGDCRKLNKIPSNSIDLIATHPPYANIISYGEQKYEGDLSAIPKIDIFVDELIKAISEFHRVLKPGKHCCILLGDTHNKCHYVPLAFKVLERILEEGFVLKEDIIKAQWNCDSTSTWKSQASGKFLLTMHEHLFVLRKLKDNENSKDFPNSTSSFLKR